MSKIRNLTVEEIDMVAGGNEELLLAYIIAKYEEMDDLLHEVIDAYAGTESNTIQSIGR